MGFTIKHGSVDTVAKLGKLAGEAIQGSKQQALALDIAMRLQQERQNAEMAEFNMMMQIESRKAQMRWEFQKIQMAQQNEFAMTEKLRMQEMEQQALKDQRRQAEYEAAIKAIDNSEILSDTDKDRMKTNTAMKFNMGPYAPQIEEQEKFTAMDAMKMQRGLEDDLQYYQDIINKFSTSKDLNWIPFSGGRGAGNLARQNDDGTWSPASEQDKAMYDYAQTQVALKLQMLQGGGTGAGALQGGPGDVLGLGGI